MKDMLSLKGESRYESMLQKFKLRQDQSSLSEALVYLKLRSYHCQSQKALTFAKKKEKVIDGTVQIDGPAGFKKLIPIKPETNLMNGWLRGEKLKYAGMTGYSNELKGRESKEMQDITRYNNKVRSEQDNLRKFRSKSLVNINPQKPKESIEKITLIKDNIMKERENRNIFIQFQGLKLDQTTKLFFKHLDKLETEGLVTKMCAFDHIIHDKSIQIIVDQANLKGKSLSKLELQGDQKRKFLINYNDQLDNIKLTVPSEGIQNSSLQSPKNKPSLSREQSSESRDQNMLIRTNSINKGKIKHIEKQKLKLQNMTEPKLSKAYQKPKKTTQSVHSNAKLKLTQNQNSSKITPHNLHNQVQIVDYDEPSNQTQFQSKLRSAQQKDQQDFGKKLQKMIKLEFLDKRVYGSTSMGFHKKNSLELKDIDD